MTDKCTLAKILIYYLSILLIFGIYRINKILYDLTQEIK